MPRPGTPDPGTLTRVIILSLRIELAPRSRYGRIRCLGLTLATPSGREPHGRLRLRCARTWAATAAAATRPIPPGTTERGHRLGWAISRTNEYVRFTRVVLLRFFQKTM